MNDRDISHYNGKYLFQNNNDNDQVGFLFVWSITIQLFVEIYMYGSPISSNFTLLAELSEAFLKVCTSESYPY